ncbi:toprim domain-containing protein [Paenirhodobacter sp. CAU 1674]|uniref:DUF7146 domain-containing protein n=1 Tax=Paenirhodobacter sp. CAU 1674 TaxID=3032596 RepID=UPI0023DCDD79|nr:toprim domain-containing protein [Paenirhodobacter sp. CAU 1674]MDF2142654.1 toprim domain-containing protein [Paenirhodobacter sp. CAU 1674]
MPRDDASDLAARLAREAEAVCRHYLPAGHKSGRYWIVGDVHNIPGRSMFVRLTGPERGKGAAGKWTDAATDAHGDLLDVIRESLGLADFAATAEEARRFLGISGARLGGPEIVRPLAPAASRASKAAQRLFAMSQPFQGALAEAYLRGRAITGLQDTASLRFHPHCYYRSERGVILKLPALVASVTDLAGRQLGAHRTWLAADGSAKASVETPRRAMGALLGHGVRFGVAQDVLAVGEGIETVLSLRTVLPGLPAVAALSAGNLGAILFPERLHRLYILRERDPAGDAAWKRAHARATDAGIEALPLMPRLGDFNDDLRHDGLKALRLRLKDQLHPDDASRFFVA